jgi:hypothetical protein
MQMAAPIRSRARFAATGRARRVRSSPPSWWTRGLLSLLLALLALLFYLLHAIDVV